MTITAREVKDSINKSQALIHTMSQGPNVMDLAGDIERELSLINQNFEERDNYHNELKANL